MIFVIFVHRRSLEGKVVPVDLKTLNMKILRKKWKSEVVLKDGMFACEKCDKLASELECLKILKVAFTMVSGNERFQLTTSKGIIEASYAMPITRKKELAKKIIKTSIKVTFNTEDCTVESIQCLS